MYKYDSNLILHHPNNEHYYMDYIVLIIIKF